MSIDKGSKKLQCYHDRQNKPLATGFTTCSGYEQNGVKFYHETLYLSSDVSNETVENVINFTESLIVVNDESDIIIESIGG